MIIKGAILFLNVFDFVCDIFDRFKELRLKKTNKANSINIQEHYVSASPYYL